LTTISPSDNGGILEASVTLLLGLLIFLTLRWQLDPNRLYFDSKLKKYEKRIERDIRINKAYLIAMFISASITVGFALFPQIGIRFESIVVPFVKIWFVITIVIVIAFIIRIIRNPPEQGPATGSATFSEV